MLEKEFTPGRVSLVPYVNAEAYYDSRYDTVNRFRLIAATRCRGRRARRWKPNVTYQYDSHSSTKGTLALGVILHVFFDASRTP